MAFQKRRSCSSNFPRLLTVDFIMRPPRRIRLNANVPPLADIVPGRRREQTQRSARDVISPLAPALLALQAAVEDLVLRELRRVDDPVELVEVLPRVVGDVEAKQLSHLVIVEGVDRRLLLVEQRKDRRNCSASAQKPRKWRCRTFLIGRTGFGVA